MAILSFPKMLPFSTAEYSKQSSNGNNPIEARDRHFHDDNESNEQGKHSNVYHLGERTHLNNPRVSP
jgi:hypothetical protein